MKSKGENVLYITFGEVWGGADKNLEEIVKYFLIGKLISYLLIDSCIAK